MINFLLRKEQRCLMTKLIICEIIVITLAQNHQQE